MLLTNMEGQNTVRSLDHILKLSGSRLCKRLTWNCLFCFSFIDRWNILERWKSFQHLLNLEIGVFLSRNCDPFLESLHWKIKGHFSFLKMALTFSSSFWILRTGAFVVKILWWRGDKDHSWNWIWFVPIWLGADPMIKKWGWFDKVTWS